MLSKVAIALALGSLGFVLLYRLRESEDAVVLEHEIEAQLKALREHLLRR